MNKISLVGRLTKDPVLTFAPGTGTGVVKFNLAVNRPHLDKTKPQEADFIPCVAFGKKAEAIANYVAKGHLFGLTGRLQINKYEKDGVARYSTDVIIDEIDFLQPKGSSQGFGNPGGFSPAQNPFQPGGWGEDITPVDEDEIPF